MKRLIEPIGYVLLFGLVLTSMQTTTTPQPDPTNVNTLHIPLTPQYASNWCWAATTSMVLCYEHDLNARIPALNQCQYIKALCVQCGDYLSDTAMLNTYPPDSLEAATFNFPGNPFSDSVGHNYACTSNLIALDYPSLQAQFTQHQPVIFGWTEAGLTASNENESENHFIVAEGTPFSSFYNGVHGWVMVNDPWPTGRGKHRIMIHSQYANIKPQDEVGDPFFAVCAHYYDTYNIQYVLK